ncbi:MAG: haloacid dehalogenase-like hydrolase, partial [Proteobacteria bacterium]|nr:haloacid dehalogenase-like hydrolase [Pseudomonadota bacterium]
MHSRQVLAFLCGSLMAAMSLLGCAGSATTPADIHTACEICASGQGANAGIEDMQPQHPADTACDAAALPGEQALSLWTADAASKKELIAYIDAITSPGADYIPPKDRIAVFDLDGTLLCETDPDYLDYSIFVYRVLEDPDYKTRATPAQIEVAQSILEVYKTGVFHDWIDAAHQKAYYEVFAGMTIGEFSRYVEAFLDQPAPGYEGMKRGEAFYKPMLEVIEYLKSHQFTVYIVSGTDRLQVRAMIAHHIDIPENQVIGSDGTIVARGQEMTQDQSAANLQYVYKPEDELVRGDRLIVKNLKMNKVAVIAQEIGKQPVLSFGNSSGDASMAQYVIKHNRYKSKAFMLLADDLVRENGNIKAADSMSASCKANGW